ncbi:MAG TPA: hypothetical protein VK804_10460 [Bradyrhizobium sp.]|jgi:hypothetical protein|uniref:hypothetical protein n=1 Tax=Bradyrhizobium sp. TaxID=376 RepID=UPI002CF172F0|nr:hypothetical protein [Bradyrhizobium sp.]HTB00887.1 hypothetical protein [Bradyrhizobium sp.]
MNASHLRGIVNRLLDLDASQQVQTRLNHFDAALSANASGSNPQTQNALASAQAAAISAVNATFSSLTPQQKRDIAELNAEQYFSEFLPNEVAEWLRQLQVAPNVGRTGLHNFIVGRQSFVAGMAATREAFDRFGIPSDDLEPGQSEIEVTLPRSLFENNLHGLQRELEVLNKIIRVFYEINNVTPGPIEVKNISTTDPVLTVAVVANVAMAIGNAVKFCIDILNGAYSLRKAMKDARKSGMVEEKLIVQIEVTIHNGIDGKIKEAAEQAVANYSGDVGRRNELEMYTNRAVKMLLERIERGMQIVPRALPPPPEPDEDMDGEARNKMFAELASIANSLEFPQVEGDPLLQLTHDQEEGQPSGGIAPKSQSMP